MRRETKVKRYERLLIEKQAALTRGDRAGWVKAERAMARMRRAAFFLSAPEPEASAEEEVGVLDAVPPGAPWWRPNLRGWA